MQHSVLFESKNGGVRQRTFLIVLETGEEIMSCLEDFARREKIFAAQITAIGALSDAVLRYFDWDRRGYLDIPVPEQVEVAALLGDVALSPSGTATLHIHLVVGKRDGTAMAGHLAEAHVRPTLEVIVTESPAYLQRVCDPVTGLALIRPNAEARAAADLSDQRGPAKKKAKPNNT